VTNAELRATPLPVSGPLTNAQLREANLATLDAGAAWTAVLGISGARFFSANASSVPLPVTNAPTTGNKLVITDLHISAAVDMTVEISEETTGVVLFTVYMTANSSWSLVTRSKFKLATINKRLMVKTNISGNIAVTAMHYSEA